MSILLINSDVANIGSWIKILRDNNCAFILSNDAENSLDTIKKIIFPGVGNFGKVIDNIKKKKLDKVIISLLKNKNIKYLGVCVGMQILFDFSEESNSNGLGLINGRVKKLNFDDLPSMHNGWNNINIINQDSKIVENLNKDKDFYFNHSYYCEVKKKENIVSSLKGNNKISTIVQKENIFGVQFHPEKSHAEGINLIKNFLTI